MSWLARSIANSLRLEEDDDDVTKIPDAKPATPGSDDPSSPRGVKEDLSELTKTLKSQFWGVASFLAPPAQPDQKPDPEEPESESDPLVGIRGDLSEIGGKFRSGISRLSENINVSEITKMASNFLQLESDDDAEVSKREGFDPVRDGAVGVTEEVVVFARDVAMHPETWLDFPLPDDDVDFDMSDAQQEHALAVERLAPRLAALRIELCPGCMSEATFWKIYFVLVHSRLDKPDAELLSTPQIVEARAMLAHEMKNRTTTKVEDLSGKKSLDPEQNAHHEEPLSVPSPVVHENQQNEASTIKTSTSETMKHSVDSNEVQSVDKSFTEEKDVEQVKDQPSKSGSVDVSIERDDDDADADDDWLKEETSEIGGDAVGKTTKIENEEDVSFSDLEEEDDEDVPTSYRKSKHSSADKESRDWVQL